MKSHTGQNAAQALSVIGTKQKGPYYWVGHGDNGIEYFIGQTFKSSKSGYLKNIQVFMEMIVGQTGACLSLYEFDKPAYCFAAEKGSCYVPLSQQMENQWVSFEMHNLYLDAQKQYAFKINCNSAGMLAIAECTWQAGNPYPDGEEWIGSSVDPNGVFHPHLGLAFLAEIETDY